MKNLIIIDNARYNQQYRCNGCLKVQEGQKGPYIIRAEITEYNSYVEEKSSKVNLFTLYDSKSKEITGVVAMDVSIVDAKTRAIVSSFPIRGTFGSAQEKTKGGLIWNIAEQEHFVQSVMDQALRVALNSAAEKVFDEIRHK